MEQSGLVTENQLLNARIQRRIDQMSAINKVAKAVGHSLDLNVTLDTALTAVTQAVGAEAGGISLIDEEAGEVVLRAQLGWIHDFVVDNPMRIPLGKGMSGDVIDNDDVIVHNNLNEYQNIAVQSFRKEPFRSIAMAPMHARGKIIGILSIMSQKPGSFDPEIVDLLRSIADTVGVAVDNARLHERHVEQENRLTAILHSTADGIIATDQNSRISLVNYTAARLLDVEADQLVGTPLREANIQVRVRDKLLLALSPEYANRESQFEVSVEGGPTLLVLASPVRIPSQVAGENRMDGWVIVLQDISHIREAEIARVQFIQAAAHDMKNPLSVTQSSVTMLESLLEDPDETVLEVLGFAKNSIGRLQRLIDDLLNIEKIETGYDFELDYVDLREMVYEIAAQIEPLMQDRSISLQVEIASALPRTVCLDREWMHRALHNYLENAAKYAPESAVVFAAYMEEEALHFEVRDDGDGIPLAAQARLFDRFYRVDNRKKISGTGLGLAIVKSVAEAHGGRVYVQSQEGQGSTFGIVLPLKQD